MTQRPLSVTPTSTTARAHARVAPATGASSKWWVLVAAVFGAFASILDLTIVNTAIPKMQAVFGADLHQISYVATGYTLAAGVVVPATAYLAYRFGTKRVFLASLALFTLGSVLCGLAWDTASIIAFRVLQGAGGAALFPLSFALVFAAFPPAERGLANGVFGIPILFAPAVGPTLGGWLVQYADWRYAFFVNVPIGLVGMLLGARVLPETPRRAGLRFDLPGFLLIAAGLGLLLYGLSNLAYDGWGSLPTVAGPILVAAALLLAWVPVELRVAQPLLDLRLFGRGAYTLGSLIAIVAQVNLIAPGFLLPQYLQNLRGLAPFPAGALLFTTGLGTLLGTIVAGRLYNRLGPRPLIVGEAALTVAASLALQRWATLTSPYGALPPIGFLRGLGIASMLTTGATAGQEGIEAHELPLSTTLNAVVRNTVAALAIAVLADMLQTGIIVHRADLDARMRVGDPAVAALYARLVGAFEHAGAATDAARELALGQMGRLVSAQATALAFQDVFLVTALLGVPALLLGVALRVPRRAGATSLVNDE